jgi:hypothetical protein
VKGEAGRCPYGCNRIRGIGDVFISAGGDLAECWTVIDDVERQVQSFIDKFDGEARDLIRALRSRLQHRLQGCCELVWDNYNFFVIGYSPTERPSDYIVSLAAGASGVSLSFNRGADLDDPDGILLGSGKVNRFVRLPTPATLQRSDVDAMIERACAQSVVPHPWRAGGRCVIRGVSAKQRPRRRADAL